MGQGISYDDLTEKELELLEDSTIPIDVETFAAKQNQMFESAQNDLRNTLKALISKERNLISEREIDRKLISVQHVGNQRIETYEITI